MTNTELPTGFKFLRGDWIYIQDLAKYGFDSEIVAGLMKHEIMPKGIKWHGKIYLPKFAIVSLINSMIKANLQVRDATDELEAEAKKVIEQVKLVKADELDQVDLFKSTENAEKAE